METIQKTYEKIEKTISQLNSCDYEVFKNVVENSKYDEEGEFGLHIGEAGFDVYASITETCQDIIQVYFSWGYYPTLEGVKVFTNCNTRVKFQKNNSNAYSHYEQYLKENKNG